MASSSNLRPIRRAFGMLHDLHSCKSWSDLEKFTLEYIHENIDSDCSAWSEFRQQGAVSHAEWCKDHQTNKFKMTSIIERFLPTDHPGLAVLDPHTVWGRSYKLTDFMTQREFEQTGLFQEGYRKVENNYQVTLQVHCSEFGLTTATFGRKSRDFSSDDMEFFDCLLPHYRMVADRILQQQQMQEAFHHIALAAQSNCAALSFDQQFHIRTANAGARKILGLFPNYDGERLPSQLICAVTQNTALGAKIQAHVQVGRKLFLVMGAETTQPIFRYISLIEKNLLDFQIQREAQSPLTRREMEIAMWVRQGKSNKDIATILGISHRTVGKHLENVFLKLGLENRANLMILNREPN